MWSLQVCGVASWCCWSKQHEGWSMRRTVITSVHYNTYGEDARTHTHTHTVSIQYSFTWAIFFSVDRETRSWMHYWLKESTHAHSFFLRSLSEDVFPCSWLAVRLFVPDPPNQLSIHFSQSCVCMWDNPFSIGRDLKKLPVWKTCTLYFQTHKPKKRKERERNCFSSLHTVFKECILRGKSCFQQTHTFICSACLLTVWINTWVTFMWRSSVRPDPTRVIIVTTN